MDVMQQIGSDSFDPGHGVLVSKTKNSNSSCGSYNCFVWVVDSHPEDINKVDFVYPEGTPKMATIGDERQKSERGLHARGLLGRRQRPSDAGADDGRSGVVRRVHPGLGKDYYANVVSTAGDATLTVAGPSSHATGHLVNGAFSLPAALQAAGSVDGAYAALPTTLKTWNGAASNDAVAISFKQPLSDHDALRTGSYAKTLTFTLSTTSP